MGQTNQGNAGEMTKGGSFLSYGTIALIAAVLSAAATWGAMHAAGAAFAQAPPPAGTVQLLTQPLADLPEREVRMVLLDRVPGDSSPPHRHPGHHTFGYVIEGTYELGIDGQPPRTLKAGDTFYEPPGVLHSVSRNAGNTEMKIVVFMVADARNPSTVNER
jgi:quercetin dioxygenase-like cupin family protein